MADVKYEILTVKEVAVLLKIGELLSKVGDGDFRRRVGLAFLRP